MVTGHLGYIGPHAVELLKEDGHYVKGIDLNLYDGCDFYALPTVDENVIKDIADLTPDDMRGFDAVLHLAGLSNDPLCEVDPGLTWRVNHQDTMHLARCAKEAGVDRFLFSSSCSLYGKAGDKILAEDDDLFPVTAYGETKIVCERELAALADDSFSPVYLRNATAYGSSPRLRLDLVLNNLMAWGYTTGDIRISSDGTPWRPLVHCRDIARAFVHLMTAPRETIHNEVFNVGTTEENYQVRDLANIVKEVLPNCTVSYTGEGSPDSRDYRVDFSKFREAFPDFQFKHTVRTGAELLAKDYERYGMTLELLEGPRFIRLRAIRQNSAFERLQALGSASKPPRL